MTAADATSETGASPAVAHGEVVGNGVVEPDYAHHPVIYTKADGDTPDNLDEA